jgi:hypothetical protein
MTMRKTIIVICLACCALLLPAGEALARPLHVWPMHRHQVVRLVPVAPDAHFDLTVRMPYKPAPGGPDVCWPPLPPYDPSLEG